MNVFRFLALLGLGLIAGPLQSYPIDDYERTGIRRLEFYRLAMEGEVNGRRQPPGGRLTRDEISLALPRVQFSPDGDILLPEPDRELSRQIKYQLQTEDRKRYGIALLDYSDPGNPVYIEHNGDYKSNVGSVGKIIAGLGLFQALADLYPDNIPARERILRDTPVIADSYSVYDHHEVPIFHVDQRRLEYRRLRTGDTGSLWEYLDWMYSASSNAAASMVLQQGTLLRHFGRAYPAGQQAHDRWLVDTTYNDEGAVTMAMLDHGIEANHLDTAKLRQGSYFTRGGKRKAAGQRSWGTPRELVRLLYRMETGSLVDHWSSLEMKRLMYMTQKRIRYASHPALKDAAVYFKSGSLYSCKEEAGFTCQKYKGNRINILGSVAIIESPARNPRLRYAVAVVSNVLYKNSAVAHQTLALRLHRLLEAQHPEPLTQ